MGRGLIVLGLVEFLLTAGIGGLWLSLIGVFLMSTAHTETSQLELVATLTGVRVAQAMTTDLETVAADRTVADFVQHDDDCTRLRISRCGSRRPAPRPRHPPAAPPSAPPNAWATTTMGAVAVPMDQLAIAAPNEPLTEVFGRSGVDRVMVVDGARLIGVITPTAMSSAVDRFSLTGPARSP